MKVGSFEMIGIVIVDGTGTDVTGWQNDEQYNIDYGNSHCSRIHRRYPGSMYQRGPTVDEAIRRCRSFAAAETCTGLILIGHSRGAAAVIGAAHQMAEEGVDVEFMGLFDAVEMDFNLSYNVDFIPSNVKNVRHGERNMRTLSRPWWGNCGDSWGGGSNFRKSFWGTHGCLGGVPPEVTKENAQTYIWEAVNALPTTVKVIDGAIASLQIWDWVLAGLLPAVATLQSRSPKDWKRGDYGKPSTWVPPGGGMKPPGNGGGGAREKYHTVKSGESLSLIAGNYWGDVLLWPIIYKSNKGQIKNPNVIEVNQKFLIPDISGYTKAQLDQTRAEGRNWR
jgi:hypothetical protein